MNSKELMDLTETYAAHNYAPLEVVLREGEGAWVTDVEGKRYLDLLSAYSALNFGHRNPRITQAAHRQLDMLTLTSRAFFTELFAYACRELAQLCRKDKVLFMNAGAEAVETAIKAARRWGYDIKGIEEPRAEIICIEENFHGRTTTIVGFSTSEDSRRAFGPFPEGFKLVPFGDLQAIENAITPHTAAVLFEPILGEGGYILPHDGFLKGLRDICTRHNVLMIADEIQTGLCRTGKVFACDHESVTPDIFILGKSLGGGILPISAIAVDDGIMKVFTPGSHGSTFGGNPLAAAVASEVVKLISEERPEENARELGAYFLGRLKTIRSHIIKEVRGRGLMIAIDVAPEVGTAKDFCKKLLKEGILCKDTRKQTIRIAPPLVITKSELDWAFERFERVFGE